jgi:hypothetical protein
MPRYSRRAAPRCELGVTGKQVRRALPLIPPRPAFRAALGERLGIGYQESAMRAPVQPPSPRRDA